MSALDLLAPDRRALFIGGEWREGAAGKRFPVKDPADGSTITVRPRRDAFMPPAPSCRPLKRS